MDAVSTLNHYLACCYNDARVIKFVRTNLDKHRMKRRRAKLSLGIDGVEASRHRSCFWMLTRLSFSDYAACPGVRLTGGSCVRVQV